MKVRRLWFAATLVAGVVMMVAGSLSAQQRQIAPGQPSIMEEEDETPQQQPPPIKPTHRTPAPEAAPAPQPDTDLNAEDQLAPSQMKQPMPAAVPTPGNATGRSMPQPAKQARSSSVRTVVACSGTFAKDSSNLGLAMVFDSRNVVFTEVDVSGAKVPASILFPKDPSRRLEVWWSNAANRSGIFLIVINGKSSWTGPGGMRLGLTLAQMEKLNHKTFKLKGFDKDNVAAVSDWDGGAFAALPGGCRFGVSLRAETGIPGEATSALSADHEYSSSDPAMKAVNPSVSEILIGY